MRGMDFLLGDTSEIGAPIGQLLLAGVYRLTQSEAIRTVLKGCKPRAGCFHLCICLSGRDRSTSTNEFGVAGEERVCSQNSLQPR